MNENPTKIEKAVAPNNLSAKLALDPATIYPPLDETRLFPVESEGLIEVEQIRLMRKLLEENFHRMPMGFAKYLVRKTEDGKSFENAGDVTFEKNKNGILIAIEEIDKSPEHFLIANNDSLQANIVDPDKLQQVLSKIFQFNEDGVQYAAMLSPTNISLEYFRKLMKEAQEGTGQELEDYSSETAQKEQVAAYAHEIKSNFNEMPEIAGLDRQKIFQDAAACVARDFFAKASEQAQVTFNTANNNQAFFLNKDDYGTLLNVYANKVIEISSYGMALRNGLIIFDQESIMKSILDPKFIEIYHLIKRENFTLPDDQQEMINLLAQYIPYDYHPDNELPEEAIGPQFVDDKEQSKEDLLTELTEQMLWSIAYHECLHVLSTSNHFLTGLDEAATYYYTAKAAFREKGVNAFGMLTVLAGAEPSIKWLDFIREFKLDPQLAEDMYFNKNNLWHGKRLLQYFAGKEEEFLKMMEWEDKPKKNA